MHLVSSPEQQVFSCILTPISKPTHPKPHPQLNSVQRQNSPRRVTCVTLRSRKPLHSLNGSYSPPDTRLALGHHFINMTKHNVHLSQPLGKRLPALPSSKQMHSPKEQPMMTKGLHWHRNFHSQFFCIDFQGLKFMLE